MIFGLQYSSLDWSEVHYSTDLPVLDQYGFTIGYTIMLANTGRSFRLAPRSSVQRGVLIPTFCLSFNFSFQSAM